MPGFANVVALHPMDMAVSKVNATARSRLDRRFGRRETDRGLKDIHTLVTLIRAGHLDAQELSRQVFQLDHEPACIAECSSVMNEILAMEKTNNPQSSLDNSFLTIQDIEASPDRMSASPTAVSEIMRSPEWLPMGAMNRRGCFPNTRRGLKPLLRTNGCP